MCDSKILNIFLEKAKSIHGDKYDYSLVNYLNNYTPVKIICPIHGVFEQKPTYHIDKGNGCRECSTRNKLTNEIFIEKARLVHGDKYDYSKVDYINAKTKVKVICPIHGEFEQTPSSHLHQKTGCSKCSKKYNYTTTEFIEKARLVHGDKYDYSKVKYKNNYTQTLLICPIHGKFEQTPSNHLSGKGCDTCCSSKNETLIKTFLESKNISFKFQHTFLECKHKKLLPFDFYLPDYNTCIEFNGKQHYEPILFFGGVKGFNEQVKRDTIKKTFCEKNKINLVIIKYDEDVISKLKFITF